MTVATLDLARYKRLAIRESETWQGGIVRMPEWVQERESDSPYRPRAAFWSSTSTGLIWIAAERAPGTAGPELVLSALFAFAKKYERELLGRPARLEVNDPALAGALRMLLNDRDTTISVVDDLPAIRHALASYARYHQQDGPAHRSLMDAPGMTIPRIRAFADAAARFYGAAPWDAIEPSELVAVDAPLVDAAMQHLMITGSTRDVRGLTFFPSRREFDRFMTMLPRAGATRPSVWFVAFDPITWLPFGDADVWEDHALPVAAADAYPRPCFLGSQQAMHRPRAGQLTFLEAVLRAIAESTGNDFDAGRWAKQVETFDGPVNVRLSLPMRLE
jgi:hypothetical protein